MDAQTFGRSNVNTLKRSNAPTFKRYADRDCIT